MIAVAFLAVCASAIVESVWSSNMQASYAQRRALILSAMQDQVELARAAASVGMLTNAASVTTTTIQGVPVTITAIAGLETDSLTLYDVQVTATWNEVTSSGTRADKAVLYTVVKQ